MKHYIHLCLIAFSMAASIIACNDPTEIGGDLINDENLLNTFLTDTLSIELNMVRADSIRTAPIVASGVFRPYLLGALRDDDFGFSAASIYSQIRLQNSDINLGTNLQLDSIVLTLAYHTTPIYGDTASDVNLFVYEVLEDMAANTIYYADQQFAYNPFPVGEKQNFQFEPDKILEVTSVIHDTLCTTQTITIPPQIRIRLSDELGWRLLSQSGTNNFKDNDNFVQFFKGLYIAASASGNAIAAFDLFSGNSGVLIYYKANGICKSPLELDINGSSAVINHFDHNYTGTAVNDALANPAPNAQEIAYLQSMAGVELEFTIPYLKDLGNIVINKAELTYFALPDTTALPTPALLTFVTEDENANLLSQVSNAIKETVSINDVSVEQYAMLINFFAQDKLDGVYDNRVETIFINPQSTAYEQLLIGGPDHPDYPMKLTLLYTVISD